MITQRPNIYQPLNSQTDAIAQRVLELSKLPEFNAAENVSALLAQHPRADAWLPLRANNQDMVVLIHKARAEVVAIVNLRPWQ